MKKSAYLLLFSFFLFCISSCGKDEVDLKPIPQNPVVPGEPDNPVAPEATISPDYVKIDWNQSKIQFLNLNTGEFSIDFNNGEIPNFKDSSSIVVLQTDTSAYLRRILDTQIDGNRVTMKTVEASIQELFRNTEFTLSFTPEANTREGTNDGVIHPEKIINIYQDGTVETLFDRSRRITKSEQDTLQMGVTYPFFDLDMTGCPINIGASFDDDISFSASWERFKIVLDRNLNMYLKFSDAVNEKEITPNFKVDVSEIEAFAMSGSMGMEVDIKPQLSAQISVPVFETPDGDKSTIIPNFLVIRTLFIIPPSIPLWINTIVDLRAKASISLSQGATVSGGGNMTGRVGVEISYIKNIGWNLGGDASFEKNAYEPEIKVDKSFSTDVKLSIYPHIEYLIYSMLGLYNDIRPYVQNSFSASSLSDINGMIPSWYMGWKDEISVGVELENGIAYRFFNIQGEIPTVPPMIPTDFSATIMEFPKDISLISPNEETEITLNKPVDVQFNVTYSQLSTYKSCPYVSVVFEPSGTSMVNSVVAMTDIAGNATVQWTPTSTKDSLIAKIYDANKDVIDKAVYIPKFRQEEKSDRDALIAFYKATGGDNWNRKDNWCSNEPISTWYGVDVQNGRVIHLSLLNNNLINEADLTEFTELRSVNFNNNRLTGIKVDDLQKLQSIFCPNNQITNLNISNLTNLKNITCIDNSQLKEMKLFNLTSLTTIECNNGQLETLEISGLTKLESINCSYNRLTNLILSNMDNLNRLQCSDNLLTELDVSNLRNLKYLYCDRNLLEHLNLSGLEHIVNLNCDDNQLIELDISSLKELTDLQCVQNQIAKLDFSNCQNIEYVRCGYNNLTQLDFSNLKALDDLSCPNNKLTYLSVSDCSKLVDLYCPGNPDLSIIDISGVEMLTNFTPGQFDWDSKLKILYLSPYQDDFKYSVRLWGEVDHSKYTAPNHREGYQYPEFIYK